MLIIITITIAAIGGYIIGRREARYRAQAVMHRTVTWLADPKTGVTLDLIEQKMRERRSKTKEN